MSDVSICQVKKKLNIIEAVFIAFCLMPFILPNPILKTDVQPYALILGLVIIVINFFGIMSWEKKKGTTFFLVAAGTLLVSLVVLIFSGLSMLSLRALYNYVSVAVIPFAAYIVIRKTGGLPEGLIKALIILWFIAGTVQLFVSRSFLTGLISGGRISDTYRGVIGLASEPSFFGIACFYFLHMAMKFKKHHLIFVLLICIMGTVYAQSAMGVIFIVGFLAIYMLEVLRSQYGKYIWTAAIIAVAVFIVLLHTVLADTRIYELYSMFIGGGFDSVTQDKSAGVRLNAILRAIGNAFENHLMPLGYGERIGSGYGGFLCEIGIFSLPILFFISHSLARTFKKKLCRFLYFIIVTVLLTNNTQIGNPLLLFVIGMNIAMDALEQNDCSDDDAPSLSLEDQSVAAEDNDAGGAT